MDILLLSTQDPLAYTDGSVTKKNQLGWDCTAKQDATAIDEEYCQ